MPLNPQGQHYGTGGTATRLSSRHGSSRRNPGRRNRGFTLIELLVVVLIIGIVLTFVSLSIDVHGKTQRLNREAHRLLALTRTAATDAVLYGVEIGLDITPKGYRFVRLTDEGWKAIADEQTLRPRELGPDLHLVRIKLDNGKRPQLVQPAADDDTNSDTKNDNKDAAIRRRPEALLLSSGELLPFVLELGATGLDQRYQLLGHADGTIELKTIGDPS